jgi:nickel-dependent lactate racemase
MHRPSTPAEQIEILGEEILRSYPVIDHDCEALPSLTFIGQSPTGGDVFVNSAFFRADLRIATGLVESHYMAGLSGGRKAICPGLVDKRTIEKFHSPAFLESPFAQNLILRQNPCHEESLAIARTVGVDFIVNTTLDRDLRLTGVFAGDLEAAHAAAGDLIRETVSVPVEQEYDIVLTHGGYVGRNHYQAVKAAHNALPAIKKGGILILATDNHDAEPIGGPEYKSLLHLLKIQGADHYLRMIEVPGWRFTKDQWEPEMWAKVFRKIDAERFFYCTHTIPKEAYDLLPGRCGLDFLAGEACSNPVQAVREMVETALRFAVAYYREKGVEPSVAFIREGPYAIPFLATGKAAVY